MRAIVLIMVVGVIGGTVAACTGDHADRADRIRLSPGTAALDAASAGAVPGAESRDAVRTVAMGPLPKITVYKSPTCGCCTEWEEHLRRFGFEVETVLQEDMVPVKVQNHVPPPLSSCHTGIVDGYVIEGHVPADLIERLVNERPQVAGLAVPGMPMGSPGMEGPMKEPYNVLTFDRDGAATIYARR